MRTNYTTTFIGRERNSLSLPRSFQDKFRKRLECEQNGH